MKPLLRDLAATITSGVLLLSGCSSNEVRPTPSSGSTSTTVVPLFTTTTTSMTAVLPAGSSMTADKVSVQTTVGTATPSSTGQVTVPVYKDDPQIAIVLNSAGVPMLMGWIDPLHTQISVGTTAEVLAYYALGGFLTLNDSDRTLLVQAIATNKNLATLTSTVSSEIVANPNAFAQYDSNIESALNSFYTTVTGVTPRKHSVVRPMGVAITPGAQSGLDVIQQPPSQAYMTNNYRRRTHAFVVRVKDTMLGPPNVDTANSANITDFEIPPTVGVNGGVTGALTDIFGAYFGNQPTAYAPIDTSGSPFNTPLTSGFDRTTYQVTVVGPGTQNIANLANLTPAMVNARAQVSVAGFVSDALVPFLTNFAFGSGFLPNAGHSASSSVSAFQAALINNIEVDLLGFIPTVPGLMDKITAGDWGGALKDMFATTANSNTVRTIFVNAVKNAVITSQLTTTLDIGSFVGAAKSFDTILNAAGGVLQVFDSGVYVTQLFGADVADQWTITVDATKVTLSPATSTIQQTGTSTFTAAVPGVDITGWSYRWTTSASVGTLSEVAGGGRSYCSSSAGARTSRIRRQS